MSISKEYKAALKGHPNAKAIEALLGEPMDNQQAERREGFVVDVPVPEEGSQGLPEYTVHRDTHWRNAIPRDASGMPLGTSFNAPMFKETDAKRKHQRGRHGLEAFDRDHRNGPYNLDRPTSRAKVLKALRESMA
jgi:hypothetical protein